MSKFKGFFEKTAADDAAKKELVDDELDAVAGGFDSHGRPECAQDWLELACEVQDEYGGDYSEAAKIVAARHNIDDYTKVYNNWVWFRNVMGEDFYNWW